MTVTCNVICNRACPDAETGRRVSVMNATKDERYQMPVVPPLWTKEERRPYLWSDLCFTFTLVMATPPKDTYCSADVAPSNAAQSCTDKQAETKMGKLYPRSAMSQTSSQYFSFVRRSDHPCENDDTLERRICAFTLRSQHP